tara:strand:+ start:683 stop:1039 length:357 start_codon:yes stop_codon:yes gene_type:complete
MRIDEVLLFELYFDDLKVAIKDRLAQAVGGEVNEIPTEAFRQFLADDGFLMSMDELLKVLNDMDVIANADENSITPKGKIPNDMAEPETADPEAEPEVDVGGMAGDQAMADVKSDLPQ